MRNKSLSEMIKVMQNHQDGGETQRASICNASYVDSKHPVWDWLDNDYRIKEIDMSFVDRLFVNAPIIEISRSYRCIEFEYANRSAAPCEQGSLSSSEKAAYWAKYRLPTVMEAPKNTWLVPWDEEPGSLENRQCLVNYGNNKIRLYSKNDVLPALWSDIKSIMLLSPAP